MVMTLAYGKNSYPRHTTHTPENKADTLHYIKNLCLTKGPLIKWWGNVCNPEYINSFNWWIRKRTLLIEKIGKILNRYQIERGFPGGSVLKRSICQCRRCGFDPWVWKSPGEGNGNPLQYSFLGNPMHKGAWWATVHGVAESNMIEVIKQQQVQNMSKYWDTMKGN